ncbi:MAG: DUF4830 domain-containing protein [Oscillospiraceae bacterium]|nr:DUF4830 domain-containing protein [Oscillospiraceae bacterium]
MVGQERSVALVFILTARVTRKRVAAAACALVALCGAAAVSGGVGSRGSAEASAAAAVSAKVRDNEDRVAYLESYGWTVEPEPVAVEELLIPETFDESYEEYLALQQSQGFDLTACCGKRVKRYTYEITNYPTGESGVQAALLVYKNRVVGGEVLSVELDGFLHGLTYPGE